MDRRKFLKNSVKAGIAIGLTGISGISVGRDRGQLSILYTNDWHSRIDPFPMDGGKYEGLGGAARRMSAINNIRSKGQETLLLDAGDIFQGTPYFNFFKGELEFKLMSKMGYDAVTLGNHDFDAGLAGLHAQVPNAKFDIINANYDFSKNIMKDVCIPHRIFRKGNFKIGVTGVGIELNNLVPEKHFGNTVYHDPILAANREAKILKEKKGCNIVICLSHLGYSYRSKKVSDVHLAKNSSHIDLILGGHTHTFLKNPVVIENKLGKNVLVCQTGWAGINLGKIDYETHTNLKAAKPHSSMLKIC